MGQVVESLKHILLPERFSDKEKRMIVRFGKQLNLDKEDKLEEYRKQLYEITLKVFPEIGEGKENGLPSEMKRVLDSLSPDLPEQFKKQAEEAAIHIHRLVNNQWEGHPETERFLETIFSVFGSYPVGFFSCKKMENGSVKYYTHPYIEYKRSEEQLRRYSEKIASPQFSCLSQGEQEATLRNKKALEERFSQLSEEKILRETPQFLKEGLKSFRPLEVRRLKDFGQQYTAVGRKLGLKVMLDEIGWWESAPPSSKEERLSEWKFYVHGENLDKITEISWEEVHQWLQSYIYASKLGNGKYLVCYCPNLENASKAIYTFLSKGIYARGPAQDEFYIDLKADGSYRIVVGDSCDNILSKESEGEQATLPKLTEFINLADYEVEFLRRWIRHCFKLDRAPNDPFMRAFTRVILEKGSDPNSSQVRNFLKKLKEEKGIEGYIWNSSLPIFSD